MSREILDLLGYFELADVGEKALPHAAALRDMAWELAQVFEDERELPHTLRHLLHVRESVIRCVRRESPANLPN